MSARYAVFGQPIAHSLSPDIHAAFGAQLGIAVDYRAIDAGRDDFSRLLETFAHDGGRGANVTLPLKEEAFASCTTASACARRAGSVNTLTRDGVAWRDIEVVRHEDGACGIALHGAARHLARTDGGALAVSLSHENDQAAAVVIATRDA